MPLHPKIISQLVEICGAEAVLTDYSDLIVYEYDAVTTHRSTPLAVVLPTTTEQVSRVVKLLYDNSIAYGPRGAGTGLSSGSVASGCEAGETAVIIETARMNKILEIDYENERAIIQPGVVNLRLSQAIAPRGFHYAPDPSSQASCTIGGNVAENSGGPHCLKYGMTTNHILGVEVVLPDGKIVNLGGDGADSIGYDLMGIFVGSEGTLGIATKVTVRLCRNPQTVVTLLADFMDVNEASRAVSAIIAEGMLPAALEMIDQPTIKAVESSIYKAGYPTDVAACLIVELDGLTAGLDTQTQRAKDICMEFGARAVREARDEYQRKKLWAGRKGAFGALGRVSPDLFVQDAVVPRTKLPQVLASIYDIAAKYEISLCNVFHAGDGNLHPSINFDSRNAEQVERVHAAGKEIMKLCVDAGGTITGEHGVGIDKIGYMSMIFDQASLDAMLAVKEVFNPTGLCNPGKAIPAEKMCREHRKVSVRTAEFD